ncbi:conserved Plasmodium protein, unknown function [Plasmodium knowlesi strain H]|uniref:MORN repeat protein n=3 Tax=Plasmodium knowlesi TaxID=5850 RepID=A0A5K1UP97_PLAKH|nr:conserved Plasmodium protein, unknown function [Plasmodium knowlesi strain H]OTN67693.1 Uncharacterized protein PKNOH_S05389900 [Plasmodium knowlesi]CAA9990486.1 conserved Plasmodium protein, unknown function [Plasmodium knowlesi strain H]SBO19707.1 conserved Plasmodium protein, unknown function [Plasmodium knowlesi strain H]SBO22477.1 conserved Plasmodium protein, unknown function [Plasmodium knowlesi strain H]VVS79960.1 conserved Plasmodium protein, unknown function [Plasmodium knowlesi s|eukprot:XP_002260875.1 hypothetical protein, conserved in Plasmodium species [Plasmodium knowlesi strain H]
MYQKSRQEIPPPNFVVNEREEFLNIFNYKNVKCFRSCNYIYIGQFKKENDPHGRRENDHDLVCKKDEDIKKIETKEFTSVREKLDKKKKKKCSKYIKDGYGILITLRRNTFGQEVIVNKFIGKWENNKKNGLGFNLYLNRNVYYGYYEDNKKNGWGHFEWRDTQSYYEGNWVNNQMNGKGTYKSKTFLFDGDFYSNKFLNSSGEWIDVIAMEEEKKSVSLLSRYVISGDDMVYLVCLPFDFLKNNLKKIADLIKYKYNKVPFFMCSKGFIEMNRSFNLSKFIFLSYYFGCDNPFFEESNYQFLFDGVQNEEGKRSEGGDSKVGLKDSNLKSSRSGTPSNSAEEVEGDSSSGESSCFSDSKKSDESSSSGATSSSDLSSGENGGSQGSDKDGMPPSNSSNWSNGRAHSNHSNASASSQLSSLSAITNSWCSSKWTGEPHDDLYHSKSESLNNVDMIRNESKGSNESDLKEYIKNANKSKDLKEETLAEAPPKFSNNCKNGMELNSDRCNEDICYEMEERKKNEMYQLMKKYVNIYANSEDTSSEYSIRSSETESSDEGGGFLKVESKQHFDQTKHVQNEQSGGIKHTDGKETVGENANQEVNNPSSGENNTCDLNPSESGAHLNMRKKKIEKELEKIKIDTKFLEKLKNCNLTCIHKIKHKMATSMMLKYPFIFSLSISEDKNKYKTITEEFLLESCTIPTMWLLQNYFGATENKLPEKIFFPPFFDFYNSNMNMSMRPHFQNPQHNDEVDNFNGSEISPLNFFLITDLLVGHTKDINHLKALVRDKFINVSFLSNLFFVILE